MQKDIPVELLINMIGRLQITVELLTQENEKLRMLLARSADDGADNEDAA